ncbi:hypothetical protein FOZ63_005220 [Perkinsus olseni]|uniref:Uncharacterized protein n=1 Tax=Perkinsus olseni TaxID=32597 RepID=A0A7J6Q9A5_PEROL|nr:hypothetical protein FOZ63_005220 [Perkinsus olseni]
MSPKQAFIGAAAAAVAVFFSELPLGAASGAVARHDPNGGFPQQQIRGTYFDGMKKAAQCFYTDPPADGPTLFLWVEEDGLATSNIKCPPTEANNASQIRYWDKSHTLWRYEPKNPPFVYAFTGRPPSGTGLNPLRDVSLSAIRDKVNELFAAASQFTFTKDWPHVWATDKYKDLTTRAEIKLIGKLTDVCLAARTVLKEHFGTYGKMCDEHSENAKEAKDTAHRLEWHFEPVEGWNMVEIRAP